MKLQWLVPVAALCLIAGCNDDNTPVAPPRDVTPPAAPRGLISTTGQNEVFLNWLANTESDVAGYRVYEGSCPDGPSCPYDRVGVTSGTSFTVTGLTNGVTRYFAIAAYDRAGNESPLSYEDVFDTPRPEDSNASITNFEDTPAAAGWDFSAYHARPYNDAATDVYFSSASGFRMIAPFTDTEIQDFGYHSTLDAVDFSPNTGWSANGIVELIVGHCYVVQIRSSATVVNYAKFRVTAVSAGSLVFDWAYQTDPNNRELKAQPTTPTPRVRRSVS
jgi:hypothetical protein